MTEQLIKEIQAQQDEDFALFMHRLAQTHDKRGYKKGSIVSFLWMLFKIHRKAKKYDLGTLMQIKLGKEL